MYDENAMDGLTETPKQSDLIKRSYLKGDRINLERTQNLCVYT